jgi:hypothetical protein
MCQHEWSWLLKCSWCPKVVEVEVLVVGSNVSHLRGMSLLL